jgi:hypothetical protein
MMNPQINDFFNVFNQIKQEIEDELMSKYSLGVKVGCRDSTQTGPDARFGEIALFKILKDEWTRTPPEQLGNDGVFFAIWVTPKDIEKRHVKYNVHALKLRTFPRYKIRAWDFANAFRKSARDDIQSLPNVNMNLGPGNLFEGNVDADITNVKEKCMPLIHAFVKMHPIIDDLLKKAEKVS